MPAYGPAIIQDLAASRSALVAPGYYAAVNSSQFVALQLLYPVVKVSSAQFDSIAQACTKPQPINDAVAALPSQIPLTVEGASQSFITSTMQQVVANTNQNAVQLNGSIFAARDQVKVHVTAQADRVIAANS